MNMCLMIVFSFIKVQAMPQISFSDKESIMQHNVTLYYAWIPVSVSLSLAFNTGTGTI